MTVDENRHRARDSGMAPLPFMAALARALGAAGLGPQLSRYAIVSALALALDLVVFLLLNAALALPTLAGVIGYGCGIVLHYHLSRRFVFDARGSHKPSKRLFSEFVASGLAGLAVTAAVIPLATAVFGLAPMPAKLLAVGASFIGVYAIRRTIVFA